MNHYNPLVEEHFFNPKCVGQVVSTTALEKCYRANRGDKRLGEHVVLSMLINPSGHITQIGYQVRGGPYLIAALSLWSSEMQKQTIDKIHQLNHLQLIEQLAMPRVKHYCAFMVEDLFKEIVTQWEQTND